MSQHRIDPPLPYALGVPPAEWVRLVCLHQSRFSNDVPGSSSESPQATRSRCSCLPSAPAHQKKSRPPSEALLWLPSGEKLRKGGKFSSVRRQGLDLRKGHESFHESFHGSDSGSDRRYLTQDIHTK